MNTLTNKDKLALQVSLALVAGMFSLVPVAQGAPVLDKIVTDGENGTKVYTSDNNKHVPDGYTAITAATGTQPTNNIVNWKDFSVAQGEHVVFDANIQETGVGVTHGYTNNYLNVVTGNGTSYIDGTVQGGNNVYLVNPHGVIMDKHAQIDVGNLYVSTQDLTNVDMTGADLRNGKTVLQNAGQGVNAEVVNMGSIQANKVYAEGTNIRFLNTADVAAGVDATTGGSDVTLNGTVYVSVGYERTKYDVNNTSATDNRVATYTAADEVYNGTTYGKSAGELKYKHDSGYKAIDDYMLVRSMSEFNNIDKNPSDNYMLYRDIAYSGTNYKFNPVGTSTAFSGKFEGNFYKISNISTISNYAGLFAKTSGATIRNLGVVNPYVVAKDYGGGIVAHATGTNIENVYVKGGTIGSNREQSSGLYYTTANAVGGIVGYASGTTIDGVYNSATVNSGAGLVGSLVGSSTLKKSYNTGSVNILQRKKGDLSKVDTHYSIYDTGDQTGTVEAVYNTGKTTNNSGHTDTTINLANGKSGLISAIGDGKIATANNYYVIDTANKKFVVGDGDDIYKAASYEGLFAIDSEGEAVTSNAKWRIYENHSLPLLRSFLKANGHGTISVNYDLGLYADATTSTASAVISDFDPDKVTYNGYYMGPANVQVGSGMSASDLGGSASGVARVKKVGKSDPLFYSTSQDGYDIADTTINVVKRNLAPEKGNIHITKVYDGTDKAQEALGKALTMSDSAVDVAYIYEHGGTVNGIDYPVHTLIETGLVKVGTTADEVSLNLGSGSDANVTATYSSGKNVVTDDTINVNFIHPENMLQASTTSGHESDYENYKFDTTPFTGTTPAVTITGDITKRPVLVSLEKDKELDKVYDRGTQVAYKVNGDAKGNVVSSANTDGADTGILEDEKENVRLSITAPYYADSNGTPVSKAGSNYNATYELALIGDGASNYEIQKRKGGNGTLTADNGTYKLTGTGAITKRNFDLNDISFLKGTTVVEDGDTKHGSKEYDYTYDFDADGVSFTTTHTISAENAQKHETGHEDGAITEDVEALQKTLKLVGAVFSDDSGNPVRTVNATKIKYSVGADPGGIWDNYTLDRKNVSAGETKDILRQGTITPRTINVVMNGSKDTNNINKVYDGDAKVVDSENKGYLGFYGTAAVGKNDTGYVKYADDTTKLIVDDNTPDGSGGVLNDGVKWTISANYEKTANGTVVTTDAQDVYLKDGEPAAKDITYTVGLQGENAINYKLVGNGEAKAMLADGTAGVNLGAMGIIDQKQVSATFADVTKQYDGTKYAMPTTVTLSDSTQVDVTPKSAAGTTVKDQIAITLSGVLAADKDYVYADKEADSFSALFNTPDKKTATTVNYSGLVLASTTGSTKANNYKIDSTGSGKGTIEALALTENNIVPIYNSISKTYDSTDTLNNPDSYVKALTVTGVVDEAGTGALLPARVKEKTTAKYASVNRNGRDTQNVDYTFIIKDTSGNYTFAVGDNNTGNLTLNTDGTYTFKNRTTGDLLARDVTAKVANSNLTKTYDAMTEYTDGNRNILSGDSLVIFSDGTEGNSVFAKDGTTNASTAKYNTADAGSVKTVTYTPTLSTTDQSNYNIIDADAYAENPSRTVYYRREGTLDTTNKLTGGGTINKRDLTLKFGTLTKTFDNSSDLTEANINTIKAVAADGTKFITLDAGTNGAAVLAADGTQTALNASKLDAADANNPDIGYAYGKKNAEGNFERDKNAGSKVIRYTGVDGEVLGGKIDNYNLYYEYQTDPNNANTVVKAAIENGVAYGLGDIGKKKLKDSDIVTTFNSVTKVYDADKGVGYTHKLSDGYDTGLDEQGNPNVSVTKTADSFVDKLTIANVEVNAGTSGYQVASAEYGSADVGKQSDNTQSAVFKFTLSNDWMNNLDFDGLSSSVYDAANKQLIQSTTKDNGNATITAKTIYASLSDQYAAPTKIYDGTKNVTSGSTQSSTGTVIDAATLRSYVDVSGLMGSDKAAVTAAYASQNVADKDDDLGNTVNLTVDLGAAVNNYKLYTKNAEGAIVDANGNATQNTNKVLRGAGTIDPKEITFVAGYTQKKYDANAKVDGVTVETAPTYGFTGLVGNETLTPDSSAITGTYVVKEGTTYKADPHVGEVDDKGNQTSAYRAVQYTGLNKALAQATGTNGGLGSNYIVAGAALKNDTEKAYAGTEATFSKDSNNGTAVFSAELANGKITKRTIENITPKFYNIEREYNTTYFVGDSLNDEKAKDYFKLEGTATGMTGSVAVDYNLLKAVFADPVTDTNGKVTGYDANHTYKNVSDTGFKAVYYIDGLSTNTLRDFTLEGVETTGFTGWYASNTTTNKITPRVISGEVVEGATQEKVYDGTSTAKAGSAYFKFDDDDLNILQKDGKSSSVLTATANYAVQSGTGYQADANANIAPENVTSVAPGEKAVAFTMKWADGQTDTAYQGNYVFDAKNGGWTDGTKTAYVGKGDIRQRIVYLEDAGGDTIAKTYDGTSTADKTARTGTTTNAFNLIADNTVTSGIISGDTVTPDLSNVSADYVKANASNGYDADANVNRNSSGTVTNKAVKFTGFALGGADNANYYLMAKANANGGDVVYNDNTATNSGMYIVESEGGKISPRKITLDAVTEKTYDATTEAKANDVTAAIESTGAADTASISRSFDSLNQTLTITANPGTGTDTITVKLSDGKYDTKDVSPDGNGGGKSDKVVTYNVNWDNGNYDLISQAAGDTFDTTGYRKDGNVVSRDGVLTDYQGKINPLKLKITGMSGTKIYDGGVEYTYGTEGTPSSNGLDVSFADADGVIDVNEIFARDFATVAENDRSINKLLGITAHGEYEGATQEVKDAARTADTSITEDDVKDENAKAADAAFNATSSSELYKHTVQFDNIAITNNSNYVLADGNNAYEGTGVINRRPVTATPSPKNANIKAGEAMPAYTGTLSGFLPTENMEKYGGQPTKDKDGNEVYQSLEAYYGDSSRFYWGPDKDVNNYSAGTHSVYGWYRGPDLQVPAGVDEEGKDVYKYELNITRENYNFNKNYTLVQDPGELVIESTFSGGGGGINFPTPTPSPTPTTEPTTEPASVPTPTPAPAPVSDTKPAAAEPQVILIEDTGYVEQPVVPDSNVYKNVSKDETSTVSHEGKAAIQYGNSGTGLVSDKDGSNSTGTIGIEVAEVVNLLGGDVASDGSSMALSNTDRGSSLSVESTESGYLSVGTADTEGTIGIETEDGISGVETEGKEGSIGLETEDEILLDTESATELLSPENGEATDGSSVGSSGSSFFKSSNRKTKSQQSLGEDQGSESSLKVLGDDKLTVQEELHQDDEDKDKKEDEDKEESEENEDREGKAAITYSDVA